MRLSRRTAAGLLVVLFLAAFFLRAYHPISRPHQWLARSRTFYTALGHRDWDQMYQSRHPGFTVMSVGGMTYWLYDRAAGTPFEALFTWGIVPYATEFGRQMALGVLGLAVVLVSLLVAITLVLRKLGGWPVAVAAAGLATFAPAYLAESRVLHVDALLSTLMLLSALLLLLSLQIGQRRYLILSGLAGGLALLTKTPALFLVPYTGLALLAHLAIRLRESWHEQTTGRFGWLIGQTWQHLALPLGLWMVVAALPFALWPAMWVEPLRVLREMIGGTVSHVTDPHPLPRFFNGRIYVDTRPGILFYPAIMAFNSSFVTLVLCLAALGCYTLWRRRARPVLPPVTFWLLVAYVFFFTLQMALGAKQSDRYNMPAQLALEILAAVGLVGASGLIQPALSRNLAPPLTAVAIGLQALVTLPFMPDYGAHRNYLLGGNRIAVNVIEFTGQNEGVLYVSDYLSRQPQPESLAVAVSFPLDTSLMQYFPGQIVGDMAVEADYYLFNRVTLQRGLDTQAWRAAWERYNHNPPQLTVSFDGVDYLWLYAAHPSPTVQPVTIRRGWVGFTALAWGVTLVFVAALAWGLRRSPPGEGA